jgi:hypothetical protein
MPTYPANPPGSTLSSIQVKVRRITRSPSETQLTSDDLNNYINTFIVYDFPEQLRTFNLRTTFSFYTNPFQDVYATNTEAFAGVTTNQLYNFQNRYLTVHPPVYIAGFPSYYSQSREQFYGIYPLVNSIMSIGTTGDGVTTSFTGVITNNTGPNFVVPTAANQTTALLQNNVLFSSIGVNNEGLALVDVPVVSTTTGNPTTVGNLYIPGLQPTTPPTVVTPANTINYVTGAYTITFPSAPGSAQPINSQTVPQVVARPQSLLYYNNQFIVRPVPDQPYQVNFECYVRPTYLMELNSVPQLEEWWQYIAYGAAKKIFEDRMDMESVGLIMPEFKTQERLCLRRSIVQYTNERTATIYTEQTGFGPGSGGWGWGGGPF